MATHSSILAWRVPWTEEPGGLQSKGLQWVGHAWSDLACTHILFIHSSVDGNLGCFHLLAVNNTTVNMSIQISLWDSAFTSFGYKPRSAISGSYGSSIFNFLRKTPYYFPRWLYCFTFRPTVHQCFSFSRLLSTLKSFPGFCLFVCFYSFWFGLAWLIVAIQMCVRQCLTVDLISFP